MAVLDEARLSPWYLNSSRLSVLLGSGFQAATGQSLLENSDDRVEAMRKVAMIAEGNLLRGGFPNLTKVALEGTIEGATILASVWGIFTMRGVARAFDREYRGLMYEPGTISGRIPLGDAEFEMSGSLFNEHLFSTSATHILSGKRRLLVAGQFKFDGDQVEMHPYIIGDLVAGFGFSTTGWTSEVRVHPQAIDAFSAIATVRPPTLKQLEVLKSLPEERLKAAIAEIIGEPFVPKDWSGETSDLTTSRLTLSGKSISAAFILKGPGLRGEMHPANLGKRGDQLTRAFTEPVDLVVIQHHDKIANAVVRQAEALASDLSGPRRYCILDGADTWRLLKAYGKLPSSPRSISRTTAEKSRK